MDWNKYLNFAEFEFECSHTGKVSMDEDFMDKLQALRSELGLPIKINSGYRDKTHPIEAAKNTPGEHTTGKAADLGVSGETAYKVLKLALKHGFTRIGINQKGEYNSRYIHLGTSDDFPNPRVWTY